MHFVVFIHINRYFALPMAKFLPIMLALCSMLLYTHYAQNYAGIIDAGLVDSGHEVMSCSFNVTCIAVLAILHA